MTPDEIIFAVDQLAEGGFVARALGFAILTQAPTLEDLRRMVRDAVRCHFEEGARPPKIRLRAILDEVLPT